MGDGGGLDGEGGEGFVQVAAADGEDEAGG